MTTHAFFPFHRVFPEVPSPGLWEALRAQFGRREAARQRAVAVQDSIELIVKGTNPKLRLIPGYRGRLRESVARCLAYLDSVVDEIPEAIEVSRRTFGADPRVNAYFASAEQIQEVFGRCRELQTFFAEHDPATVPAAHALLCMKRVERTVFGVELEGGMLKRDVMQTSVSFSAHQVFSPCETEREVRRALKCCLFNSLIRYSKQYLQELQAQRSSLEEARRRLLAQQRAIRANGRQGEETTAREADLAEMELKLEQNARALRESGPNVANPDEYLAQLADIFQNPERFLRIEHNAMKVSRMGIKMREDTPGTANDLDLNELEVGGHPDRVVVLVKYRRSELASEDDPFARAMRYL